MKKVTFILTGVCLLSLFVWGEITIMSYNIKDFWLRFDGEPGVITSDGGSFSNQDAEKLLIISSLIHTKNPDVIAVLESASLAELFVFNSRFLDNNYRCWSFRGVDSRQSGIPLGLLVRKELQVHSIELFEPRSFSQRGIIIADISKGNYRFTLIAVHLKAKIEEEPGESALKRDKQCTRLREVIKKKLKKNPAANIIICGDFNDSPGRDEQEKAAEVKDMIERMGEPIAIGQNKKVNIHNVTVEHKDLDQNEKLWTEKSKKHGEVLFDYFFLTSSVMKKFKKLDHVYPEEYVNIDKASDHLPVLLYLKDN